MKTFAAAFLVLMSLFLVQPVCAQSVSVAGTGTRTPGTTIQVSASGASTRWDWVSLAVVGSANNAYVTYQYMSGSSVPPTTVISSNTLYFTLPWTTGTYEIRMYYNNGYTRIATSASFVVDWPAVTVGTVPAVVSPATVVKAQPGHSITAAISGGPATTTDWVALAHPADSNNTSPVAWSYMNGSHTPPSSGTSSANLTFTLPTAVSTYELRFFPHNTYSRAGTSALIEVSEPISVNGLGQFPLTLPVSRAVTASISNAVTSTLSWIGLFPTGAAWNQYVSWQYLNGTQTAPSSAIATATLNFTLPATPGTYEFRLYQNDVNHQLLGTSPTISVIDHEPPSHRHGVVGQYWDANISAQTYNLGAGFIRFSCDWIYDQPTSAPPTWGCSEPAIKGALAQGLKVLMTINCTPAWANSTGDCYKLPTNMSDWTNYVQAFITKYQGLDVVLGIYNEAGLHGMSSSDYCSLYKGAGEGRWNANPTVPFAFGVTETSAHALATGQDSSGWYAATMYCITHSTFHGLPSSLATQDVVTAHWYPDGLSPSIGTYVDAVHSAATTNPVWITELGVHYNGYGGDPGYWQGENVAWYMREIVWLGETRPWFERAAYFVLPPDEVDDTSLFGSDFNSPRPAFFKYQDVIQDATGGSSGTLHSNQSVTSGTTLFSSSGLVRLKNETTGRLVLSGYDGTSWIELWSSGTSGSSGSAIMQSDGNFVLKDAGGSVLWSSQTNGNTNAYLVVQNNGTLYVYSETGVPVFSVNDPY